MLPAVAEWGSLFDGILTIPDPQSDFPPQIGTSQPSDGDNSGIFSPIGHLTNRDSPFPLLCWFIIGECQGFSLVVPQELLRGISMLIA